jgi:hypothetical protein
MSVKLAKWKMTSGVSDGTDTTLTTLATVLIHDVDGYPYYVRLVEIPEPWRARFREFLFGHQMPVISGDAECAYVSDWREFVGRNS